MRSSRPSYASTPAGSAKALSQKPRPRRSKREWNQILLMVFFIVLPVLGLFAIFFQPVRWLFMLCVVAAIAVMWMLRAFLLPGRLILSAAYGLTLVFTLVTALSARPGNSLRNMPTFAPAASATPAIQTTPQFSASMMGTSVPEGYYGAQEPADGPAEGAGGQDDPTDAETEKAYVPGVRSGAEIALENFMERWRRGIIADMVEYTAPSWRTAQQDSAQRDAAQQQLFWKFANKPLSEWRQLSAPTGTEASGARTITVQADISYYDGEVRTYEYEAITLYENGQWYVDPDSLSSGILKEAATPTPDPNTTPTPSPEPTATPTPGPKTKLYYNKDGGKRYHIEPECYTVDKSYLPLASFNYGDIGKHPKLVPCEVCGAPERP